jgi:hypothetical protein
MGDIVNLNKARKARAKAAKDQGAVEHRVVFGQTKAAKMTLKDRLEKARRDLDQMRREKPPES